MGVLGGCICMSPIEFTISPGCPPGLGPGGPIEFAFWYPGGGICESENRRCVSGKGPGGRCESKKVAVPGESIVGGFAGP